jgi:phosphoribosyl-AMP cyclohydrolase / phosphoribosyl-ATP pyrophosphohydrolase
MSWTDGLKYDERGLLPVVAQEARTGEVLMLAYANVEALEQTAATGRAHYWSRSRAGLWCKGESSGHVQEVVEIRVDCDGDAVLYRVRQTGPACHTLEPTCFHRAVDDGALAAAGAAGHVLARVAETVRRRHLERPEKSYTTYLFAEGLDKILKKVGEESTEVVIAAKCAEATGDAESAGLPGEVADLLFHVVVMLQERGVPLARIWEEMERRFGAAPRRTTADRPKRPEP